VIIAHRFGFGQVHGVEVLDDAEVLGQRCDNRISEVWLRLLEAYGL